MAWEPPKIRPRASGSDRMSQTIYAAWEKTWTPGSRGPPLQAQRPVDAAVGQGGVSRGHLQEAHFGISHHQPQAVVVGAPLGVIDEVQLHQVVVEGLGPHLVQEIDGGEITAEPSPWWIGNRDTS